MGRLGAAAIALLVLGCGMPAQATNPISLISVDNFTTDQVTVLINGVPVHTVPADGGYFPVRYDLPPKPFTVEAQAPNGLVLATVNVGTDTDVSDQHSVADVEFLDCGEVALWVGGPPPDAPVPPGPSTEPCGAP